VSAAKSIVSVRVSAEERRLQTDAAGHARTTLSDFVRRSAVEQAELALLDRRVIAIAPEDWERFEAWLHEPPRDVPALRKLAERAPEWQG
jgi:uncharacterized protein (DUF1778 family)